MAKHPSVDNPKHVASLDFDSCLYQGGRGNRAVKKELFETELARHEISELYVGTSRQSTHLELANIERRDGASYERFESFAGEKYTLHKGLTADAWVNKPFGHTFQKTKDVVTELNAEAVCNDMEDERAQDKVYAARNNSPIVPGFSTKIDILYMQMQDAYQRADGGPVVFHFYDDSERILEALHAFYSTHPDMIPAKMSLALHKVEGDTITSHKGAVQSGRQIQFILSEAEISACTRAGLAKAVADLKAHDEAKFEMSHRYVSTLDQHESFKVQAAQSFKHGVLDAESKLTTRFRWLLASKNKAFIPLVAVSAPLLAAAATFTALAAPSMVLASNPLMISAAVVAG